MNCIYVESRGSEWQYKQLPIPVLQSGQVLIKVEAAAINRCDLNFTRGLYPSKKTFPCVPGFEGSGTILLTGGGMTCWGMAGKRVAFYTESQYGSFADYSIAEAINCVELDADQSFEEGCCAIINPISVIGMLDICKSAKVPCVINNAATSSLGLMLNRLFKDNGINVINIVRRSEAVQELQGKGYPHVLNSNEDSFIDELEELAKILDARIFFDALSGELSSTILHAMPKHSTVYVYGRMAKTKLTNISAFDLISQAQCVKGFWFDRYLKSTNVVSLQLLLRKAKSLLKTTFASTIFEHVSLFNNQFLLSQFQEAIDLHDSDNRRGKIILIPNQTQLKSKQQQLRESVQKLVQQAQEKILQITKKEKNIPYQDQLIQNEQQVVQNNMDNESQLQQNQAVQQVISEQQEVDQKVDQLKNNQENSQEQQIQQQEEPEPVQEQVTDEQNKQVE